MTETKADTTAAAAAVTERIDAVVTVDEGTFAGAPDGRLTVFYENESVVGSQRFPFSNGVPVKIRKKALSDRIAEKSSGDLKIFRNIGLSCFVCVALLLVWNQIIKLEALHSQYFSYVIAFTVFEERIAAIENKWIVAVILMALFFARTFIPLVPFFVFYVISGMVFPLPVALTINFAGTILMMTVKYYYGRFESPVLASKLFKVFPAIKKAMEENSNANSALLFFFRITPVIPFGMVSQIYGSLDFPFLKYLLISLLAYAPKLVSYAFMGMHFYDPFSGQFLLPLIILLLISGTASITFRFAFERIRIISQRNDKRAAAEE